MRTLLLPGTLCNASLWSGVALPAGAHAWPVVRGRTLAEAASQAVSGLSGPLHVVGFSLGAIVAFEVLRLWPQRVQQLTLISANPLAPTAAQLTAWASQEAAVLAGPDGFEGVSRQLAMGAGAQAGKVLAMARQVGPTTFLEQLALLRERPDSRPALQAYRGPLTLLVGTADTVTPPGLSEAVARIAPQADVHMVPGAGHYLPLEAPEAVLAQLGTWAHA